MQKMQALNQFLFMHAALCRNLFEHSCIFRQVKTTADENYKSKSSKGAIKTTNRIKPNIVLVGFMGSGKTVIGRTVANLLNYDFVDTDEYIKDVTGMDLAKLYRKHGEIRFRSEEKLAIRRFAAKERQVIACGGSLPPDEEWVKLLSRNGYIVLLTAAPDVIMSRIGRKNDRFITGKRPKEAEMEAMLRERERFFERTEHITIDTGTLDVEEAADLIVAQYNHTFDE